MAKDKSKKKASKSTESNEFAKPSEAPAGGDGWSLTDGDEKKSGKNDGKLFLITPLRSEQHEDKFDRKNPGATKEHIVADIVQLHEKKPEKSEEHENIWIFGGWLMGAVRGRIDTGEKVLGRLTKEPDATSGTGYVWKLEDADDDDVEVARAYLKSLDPFPKKGGKVDTTPSKSAKADKKGKAKAEPEPKKKAKKAPEPKKGKGKKKK